MTARLQKTLRQAQAHHQAGRLSQAEALYRSIAASQPDEPAVLHLLGLIAYQRAAYEEADQWIRRAIAAAARPTAELSNSLGAVLAARGRPVDAARCFQEAVALRPDYIEALQNLGRTLQGLDRAEEAAPHFEKVVRLNPANPGAWLDMGSVFVRRKMAAEAIACFQKAVDLDPRYAEAWNNLGNSLHAQGRQPEAIAAIRQALALQPQLASAHNNLGVMLREQGAPEAMACFEKAVLLDPRHADAWNNLGNMLRDRGRVPEAIACAQKAIALRPGFAAAHSNLSVMLHEQGKLPEAIQALQQALALAPGDAASWSNLGNCLKEQCRFHEAIACYSKAVELQPGNHRARWNRSLTLFMTGEIERAWIEYESGWADGQRTPRRPFPQPLWDGGPLDGKRLLFWGEQGIGDEIILAGMIPDLGSGHIVECEPRLVPLFARSFPSIEVVPRTTPPHPATAQADLQIPAGSAARWLRGSLDRFPKHQGYLRPDPQRIAHWREHLDALGSRRKAGICWRSGVTAGLRSMHCTGLQQWGAVLSAAGVHFINLQYDDCRAELDDAEARFGVRVHAVPGIDLKQDLDDAAALTAALDLIITVSTSVADMAGALGKPVWLMALASQGNWYTMGQPFVPWFPSTRLYPRTWEQPWEDVLARVARDLAS